MTGSATDLARQMSQQGYVGTPELVAHPGRFLMSPATIPSAPSASHRRS